MCHVDVEFQPMITNSAAMLPNQPSSVSLVICCEAAACSILEFSGISVCMWIKQLGHHADHQKVNSSENSKTKIKCSSVIKIKRW